MSIHTLNTDVKVIQLPNIDFITYKDVLVGYTVFDPSVSLFKYLVLVLNTRLLPAEVSKDITRDANAEHMRVVFVLDIINWFGTPHLTVGEQKQVLARVAAHSTEDITTAVMVGTTTPNSTIDFLWKGVIYTYNQKLGNKRIEHAESVLANFLEVCKLNNAFTEWFMLLEPCETCLKNMIGMNASVISYVVPHKAKWNTETYLTIKRELQSSNKIIYTQEVSE